jgi:hypothetical protein
MTFRGQWRLNLKLVVAYLIVLEIASWLPAPSGAACVVNPANYGAYYAQHNECPAFHKFLIKFLAGIIEILGDPNWAIAIFTGILAVATIGLGFATLGLYRAGERQLSHLKNTASEARRANELTRDAFIADQRPWLRWEIQKVGRMKVNGPRPSLEVNGIFQNLGRTPAMDVCYSGSLYIPGPQQAIIDIGRVHFREHRRQVETGFFPLATILPTEAMPFRFTPSGITITDLPDSFTLYLAFHAFYFFSLSSTPGRGSRVVEIGTVYAIQSPPILKRPMF